MPHDPPITPTERSRRRDPEQARGLFILPAVPWPVSGGREIYSHHLIEALVESGHAPRVLVAGARDAEREDAWPLRHRVPIAYLEDGASKPRLGAFGWFDRRWRRYWGWSDGALGAVRRAAEDASTDFIAGGGLGMLPALRAAPGPALRIWMALDEPALYQRSLAVSAAAWPERMGRLGLAATFTLYQRAYARHIDAAVAVSPADADQLRRTGGFARTLTMPNGVDADYFRPTADAAEPNTAVFWGRLDFPPNIDAITWFVRRAWPRVRARRPEARLRIIGRNPTAAVRSAASGVAGVELVGPVDDLRGHACRAGAVVLPMRSGAGIKNKLLEAAALGRPIIASLRAVDGLTPGRGAWRIAATAEQWVEQLASIWDDPRGAAAMGRRARQWVEATHRWAHSADQLAAFATTRRAKQGRPPAREAARRRAA